MKLFLDSSAIIEFLKGNDKASDAIAAADELYTSSICAYEVLVGEKFVELKGMRSAYQATLKFFDSVLTLQFTYADSVGASKIAAELMLSGKKVNDFDVLLASQALANGATILTKDSRHFEVIKDSTGLSVEAL